MMRTTISRRALLATALVAAALAGTATPASATRVNNPLGGTSLDVWLGHSLGQSITVTPVPSSLNGYSVTAACTAFASPDPVSTAVEECSIDGVDVGTRISLPGPTSTGATVATGFKGTWVTACVQVSASFTESVLGPGTITHPRDCYPVFLP